MVDSVTLGTDASASSDRVTVRCFVGSYDLYRELELDPALTSEALGDLLDRRIGELLDEGLSPTSPEVDQLITGRAVLADPVKRDTYDAALKSNDDEVTVTWLHLLADAPPLPRRAQSTTAFHMAGSPEEEGIHKRAGKTRGRIRIAMLVLILLGCLGALGVVIAVDASERDASSLYLRVLVGFLGYVACIVTVAELIRAMRR